MPNTVTYLRQDQATISVPVLYYNDKNGNPVNVNLPPVLSWATLEGGDLESEDVKTRPGGMVGQVNLGGPTTRTDATVSRPYTADLHPYLWQLEAAAGSGTMHITWTILNSGGFAVGNGTVTLTGILKNVTRPQWDSNANGAAMLSLVMGCDVASSESTS